MKTPSESQYCEQEDSTSGEGDHTTHLDSPVFGPVHTGSGDIKIYHVGESWPDSTPISWLDFREACRRVSQFYLAILAERYDAELYAEREELRRTLDDFVASDKCILMVVGESGSGKTCFICATVERLEENPDIACVVYDCPSLTSSISLLQHLNSELANVGKLESQNPLRSLERSNDLLTKRMIVFIDAINEHKDMRQILEMTKGLIATYGEWTRIVISCRSHAWDLLRKHMIRIRLPVRLFYSYPGNREPIVRLGSFSESEADLAFRRYQDRYGFQSGSFGTLQDQVREVLKDPLMLWLMAEAHQGKKLPDLLGDSDFDFIGQYMNFLIDRQIIWPEDASFLVSVFAPACVTESTCANELNYEALLNLYPEGEDCILRLLHSGILVQHENFVRFRYERFYDYHVGKYILEWQRLKSKSL